MRTRLFVPILFAIIGLLTLFVALPALAVPVIYVTSVEYKDNSHNDLLINVDPTSYASDIHGYTVWFVDSNSGETITTQDFSPDTQLKFTVPGNTADGDYTIIVKAKNASDDVIAEASWDFTYERGAAGGDDSISPLLLIGAGAVILMAIVAFGLLRSGRGDTSSTQPVAPSILRPTEQSVAAPPVSLPIQKIDNLAPSQPAASPGGGVPVSNNNTPAPHAPRPDNNTIFVSYSRTDWIQFVEPMIKLLNAQELSVWLDQHLLESGDDWLDKIGDALETCDRMILCVSPEALESRFVKMEYRYFFNHGKKIYPLICRAATDVPPELQGIQYFPYERLNDLIAILKRAEAAEPRLSD